MNNVDVLIKGVNKCNLHLILEHLDPGLNLPVYLTRAWAEGYSNHSVCLSVCYQGYSHNSAFYVLYNMAIDRALTIL